NKKAFSNIENAFLLTYLFTENSSDAPFAKSRFQRFPAASQLAHAENSSAAPFAKSRFQRFPAASQLTLLMSRRSSHGITQKVLRVQALTHLCIIPWLNCFTTSSNSAV
ncbi:MAG: hypothetical protein ACI4ER_00380, partial [Suilimivivens sp.]